MAALVPMRRERGENMKGAWRYRYDYQAASWIVYRGSRMLRDYYPTEQAAAEAAAEAAKQANERMRKAGRTAWSRGDYNEAVRTFNKLWKG